MQLIFVRIFNLSLLFIGSFLLSVSNLSSNCNTNASCDSKNSCDNSCDNSKNVNYQTHFALRPQDLNAARWLIGTSGNIHICDKDEFYGYLGLILECTKSFKNKSLASYFGDQNGRLSFGQGTIEDNDPETIKAINWGLTGKGDTTLCAKINNIIADFQFWFSLEEWVSGCWADIRLPIAWTKWQLAICCDNNYQPGSSFYPESAEQNSVSDLIGGETQVVYTDLQTALNGSRQFGLVPALKYGKFSSNCNSQTASGISGLRFDVGYDFYRNDNGYAGLGITFVAPTGNTPTAFYLFEPIVGAQKNWQIGGTLVAGWEIWNCDNQKTLTAYFDSTFVTLVKSSQRRLFGLKDHDYLSSFMLVKQLDSNDSFVTLDRLANYASAKGKFGSKYMTDIALMFQYTNCGFIAALGYDFWYRSKEECSNVCYELPSNTYVLKGSLACLGEQADQSASKSTIFVPAEPDENVTYLSSEDLTVCPALNPAALSNKVFGSFGYQWLDCEWMPSLVLFGEVEFGRGNTAVSQWGAGLKGGITF